MLLTVPTPVTVHTSQTIKAYRSIYIYIYMYTFIHMYMCVPIHIEMSEGFSAHALFHESLYSTNDWGGISYHGQRRFDKG